MKSIPKRILSVFLALAMIVLIVPFGTFSITASAGTVTFAGGNGSVGNPYLIETKEQLDAIRNLKMASYKLIADIVFLDSDFEEGGAFYNDGAGWISIGNNETWFSGTFDGDGHVIKNLKINSTKGYNGFFGRICDATVKNVGILNCDVYGDGQYVAGLCGFAQCSDILNCYTTGQVYSYRDTGGIVGYADQCTISDCYNDCNILCSSGNTSGGICASAYNTTITNCCNSGTVDANIIRLSINNYHYGIGGICGILNNSSSISNCFNIGKVKLIDISNGGSYEAFVGGIAGITISSSIDSCYNVGELYLKGDNTFNIFPISGGNKTNVTNCYCLGYYDISNNSYTSCTEEQLMDSSTYQGFDFENTWTIDTSGNYKYPILISINNFLSSLGSDGFAGGNGSVFSPYLVSTKEQLNHVRDNLFANYTLINDIAFEDTDFEEGGAFYNDGAFWIPIGDEIKTFDGIFDGNGHLIENLKVNATTEYSGLFGKVDATIIDLGVIGATITSTTGYASGICGYFKGTMDSCYFIGDVSGKGKYVAGVCGRIIGCSSVSNCYNLGNVNCEDESSYYGGICGYLGNSATSYDYSTINNCYSFGLINGKYESSNTCSKDYEASTVVNLYNFSDTDVEKMTEKSTYEGFDFEGKWSIGNNPNYPLPNLLSVPHKDAENTKEFDGGNGRFYNPYLVSTKEQLNNVRNHLSAYYKLIDDIVFEDTDFEEGGAFYNDGMKWLPIGYSDTYFSGTFDGDGHTISNLQSNSDSYYVGLFGGCINATILNVGLVDSKITSLSDNVGGICGIAQDTTISNCYYSGSIKAGDVSNDASMGFYVGGICGYLEKSTVTNCYNLGSVEGLQQVGGICGYAYDSSITNCYNTGSLNASDVENSGYFVGGICGEANKVTITNCYNTGDVSGDIHVGGICGEAQSSSIGDCYNMGSVNARLDVAGGICGRAYDPTITNCYNVGSVCGDKKVGGICGHASIDSIVSNCYYLNYSEVGIGYLDGGTDICISCTIDQLKDQTTFVDFDFDNIWEIDGTSEYILPTLRDIKQTECVNHVWDSGVEITRATYHSTGLMEHTCLICGATKAEVTPATIHEQVINEDSFPDEIFREYVSENFDIDKDGILSVEELINATGIYVDEKGISSLKGVEYFAALEWLDCDNNQLTELDVSKNTELLDLSCSNNNLTKLDVSKNIALVTLYCYSNQLKALDVSNNTALEILHCYNNKLTTLDVSKNTVLESLHCENNKLTTLDVSNNTLLDVLNCSNNQLTELDVSKNIVLWSLVCKYNQLTKLDVSKNIELNYLYCSYNQLKKLDVSKNTALLELYCTSNELTTLDLSTNTKLWYLSCYNNQLTSINLPDSISELFIDDGVIKYNGNLVVLKKNVINTSYTGLSKYGSYYYYFKNGVNLKTTDVIKMPSYSSYKANTFVYIKTGKFQSSYTGLAKKSDGTYWYVVKGVVQTSKTGLLEMPSTSTYNPSTYVYLTSGELDTSKTGIYKNSSGKLLYISKGVYNTSYKGIAKMPSDGTYWYVENGKIVTKKTGLYKMPSTSTYQKSKTVYISSGKLLTSYTGLKKDSSGNYWYVVKGIVSTNTGLVKLSSNSTYYKSKTVYIKSGKLQISYTGLVKDGSKYKYVVKGIFTTKTGSVKIPSTSTYYKGKTVKLKSGIKVS